MNPYILLIFPLFPLIYFMTRDFILYKKGKRAQEEQKRIFQDTEKKMQGLFQKMKQEQKELYHMFQELNELSKSDGLFEINDKKPPQDKPKPKA